MMSDVAGFPAEMEKITKGSPSDPAMKNPLPTD